MVLPSDSPIDLGIRSIHSLDAGELATETLIPSLRYDPNEEIQGRQVPRSNFR